MPKSKFLQFFFPEKALEKFVHCSKCRRKFHEVCVLYQRLSQQIFNCPQCRAFYNLEHVSIRASLLPSTGCDRYITNFLRQQGVNEKEQITIRLMSNMKAFRKLDADFKDFREADDVPYQNCTLFAFVETGNDSDICFFSVIFQLYTNDSPDLYRNTAYISYIDSINLMPTSSRTKIYRLILLGLFEYLKSTGTQRIFLWSCPSQVNQDYIFYKKPPKMKMPNKVRLAKWYRELLALGVRLNVIYSYKDIRKYSRDQCWRRIEEIPLLDGDLWITRMHEVIAAVAKEDDKVCKELMNLKAKLKEARACGDVLTNKKVSESLKKLMTKPSELEESARLWSLMDVQVKGFSSEYFVINLMESSVAYNTSTELEKEIPRQWINSRHLLVDFFWEQMLEFSDERQAQFSTHSMLYRALMDGDMCAICRKHSPDGVNVS